MLPDRKAIIEGNSPVGAVRAGSEVRALALTSSRRERSMLR